MLGFAPVIGSFADAANGVIHVARGNYIEAGFSVIAVVPVVGDAVAGGRKVAKAAGKAGDLIKTGSNLDDRAKALNKVNEGIGQVSHSQTKVDINIAPNKPGKSDHAVTRGKEGRPVGPAISDAQKASQRNILVQDDGRYIVLGKNGRVHVFDTNGVLITSMRNSVANTRMRIIEGRWRLSSEEQFTTFKKLLGEQ